MFIGRCVLVSCRYNIEEKDATSGGLQSGLLEFDFVSLMPLHRMINVPPMPVVVYRLFLHEFAKVSETVTVKAEVRSYHYNLCITTQFQFLLARTITSVIVGGIAT
eukprot:COSAG05_NODE_825_length_7106_cov_74.690881_5_plen_106_part_00